MNINDLSKQMNFDPKKTRIVSGSNVKWLETSETDPVEFVVVDHSRRMFYIVDKNEHVITMGSIEQFRLPTQSVRHLESAGIGQHVHKKELEKKLGHEVEILWHGCGFATQPHYSRVWKHKHGISSVVIDGKACNIWFNWFGYIVDAKVMN